MVSPLTCWQRSWSVSLCGIGRDRSVRNAGRAGAIGGKLVVGAIRWYQVTLSPLLGPACRYYPTCSHYAVEAVQKYGVRTGGWLAVRRLLRCHPFKPGGYDPVP